jgi:hypothetical protein
MIDEHFKAQIINNYMQDLKSYATKTVASLLVRNFASYLLPDGFRRATRFKRSSISLRRVGVWWWLMMVCIDPTPHAGDELSAGCLPFPSGWLRDCLL